MVSLGCFKGVCRNYMGFNGFTVGLRVFYGFYRAF